MSDNITIVDATGTNRTVASDNISSVFYQRVKPVFGVDGAGTDVSASNGLPVEIVAGTVTLTDPIATKDDGPVLTPSITVTAGGYTAGDVVGGEITLTNAMAETSGKGFLDSLVAYTANGATPDLTFHFFDSNPAANVADNGVFAWGAGDGGRWLGHVVVATGDWSTVGSDGVVTKANIGLRVAANGTQNLYLYIIAGASTPTFAATSDLIVRLGFSHRSA